MTVDEAIEQARWYEREDIATTLRESASVLADECERLRDENERRREELRLAQCQNPRDPEHGGHCETCSGLSVARTRRLHELEAECERLRERVKVLEAALRPFAKADFGRAANRELGAILQDAPVVFKHNWCSRVTLAPVFRGADFHRARAALAKGGE